MTPTPGHPNAWASLVTTGLAWAILHISTRYNWVTLSSQTSLLIAGGAIVGVLFVGRRGIRPTLGALWNGASSGSTPKTAKPPAKP